MIVTATVVLSFIHKKYHHVVIIFLFPYSHSSCYSSTFLEIRLFTLFLFFCIVTKIHCSKRGWGWTFFQRTSSIIMNKYKMTCWAQFLLPLSRFSITRAHDTVKVSSTHIRNNDRKFCESGTGSRAFTMMLTSHGKKARMNWKTSPTFIDEKHFLCKRLCETFIVK